MSGYTPGPWGSFPYYDGKEDGARGVGPGEYDTIAHVRMGNDDLAGTVIANACLISAAPDMLEALEAAIECGIIPKSSAREGGANRHVRQAHVADMIRSAIAKAKGETE